MNKTKIIAAGLALSLLIGGSSWALAAGKGEKKEPASLDADTVEYDMKTGEITATDNVLMKRGEAKVAGQKAAYNLNTMDGYVVGNVIAIRGDIRITCDKLISTSKHILGILYQYFTGKST